MPKVSGKVTQSKSVWRSPDGSREIFELMLDVDGKQFRAKTYSKDISQVGWSGEVETYEKQGRNGSETFVKQPPKESGWSSGGGRGFGGGQKIPVDNYTMYLSYVKDIAVALINGKAYTVERLNEIANDVATAGEMFYEMRPDNKDKVADVPATQDEIDGGISNAIDEVFFNDKQEEDPWNQPNEQLPV